MTIIPLTSDPAQTLRVELEGELYSFRITFNERSGVWSLDISDVDGAALASGVALVAGTDILSPYSLNIGALVVVEVGSTGEDANADNLGEVYKLAHITEEELLNGITV